MGEIGFVVGGYRCDREGDHLPGGG